MVALHILLPARDPGPWLDEALEDIPTGESEVLVWLLDDGSRESEAERMEELGKVRRNLRVLHLGEPGKGLGVGAALERGRKAAMAEGARFIGRMDGDDRCDPERFARARELLDANEELAAVGCTVRPLGDLTPAMARYLDWQNGLLNPEELARARFLDVPMMNATCVFRAQTLEALGGWQSTPWSEDTDLWLRFFAAGFQARKLPELLYSWRLHPGQETRKARACSSAALRRGRAHHLVQWLTIQGLGRVQLVGTGSSLRHWLQALHREDPELNLRSLEWNARRARAVHRITAPPLDPDRTVLAVMSGVRVRQQFAQLCPEWHGRQGDGSLGGGPRMWYLG